MSKKQIYKAIIAVEIIIIAVIVVLGVINLMNKNNDTDTEEVEVYEVDLTTEVPVVETIPEAATEVAEEPVTETESEVAENDIPGAVPDVFKAQLITAEDNSDAWINVDALTEDFKNPLKVKRVSAQMDGRYMFGYYEFTNSSATASVSADTSDANNLIYVDAPYGKYGENEGALIIWDCDTPWFDEAIQDALYDAGICGVYYDGHYDAETGEILLDSVDPAKDSIQFKEEDFK